MIKPRAPDILDVHLSPRGDVLELSSGWRLAIKELRAWRVVHGVDDVVEVDNGVEVIGCAPFVRGTVRARLDAFVKDNPALPAVRVVDSIGGRHVECVYVVGEARAGWPFGLPPSPLTSLVVVLRDAFPQLRLRVFEGALAGFVAVLDVRVGVLDSDAVVVTVTDFVEVGFGGCSVRRDGADVRGVASLVDDLVSGRVVVVEDGDDFYFCKRDGARLVFLCEAQRAAAKVEAQPGLSDVERAPLRAAAQMARAAATSTLTSRMVASVQQLWR